VKKIVDAMLALRFSRTSIQKCENLSNSSSIKNRYVMAMKPACISVSFDAGSLLYPSQHAYNAVAISDRLFDYE
jgi:hypothetical protein